MAVLAMLPTDSGQFNQKVVTHPASSLAQDRESSPAETSVLTTMLRRQLSSPYRNAPWVSHGKCMAFHGENM